MEPEDIVEGLADMDEGEKSASDGSLDELKTELDAIARQLQLPHDSSVRDQEPAFLEGMKKITHFQPHIFFSSGSDDPEGATVDERAFLEKRHQSADIPKRAGRYEIQEEIARGGMGVVLRARDSALDRHLAVKIILRGLTDDYEAEQRFLAEARVTGRLQHPGIAPVHELGRLENGQPFFAMKLIEGRTFAALLNERDAKAEKDKPQIDSRFIHIFERICQTMAYAHDHGVIHRDLKPSNIMVGAFGEVQVMDWGLAKEIRSQNLEGRIPKPEVGKRETSDDERPTALDSFTQIGAVMGTPGFMAPEQARGEIDLLDERCDVFGLGGILCQILTGQPPFTGDDKKVLTREMLDGDLSGAFARLDRCSADRQLVEIAKRCLAPKKEDRPKHAGEVNEAIQQYVTAVEQRLRQAELNRAAAEATAKEERKRRRIGRLLAAVVVLLVIGTAAATLWYQQDRVRQSAEELRRQGDEAKRHALLEQGMEDALQHARQIHAALNTELAEKGGVFKLLNTPERWRNQIDAARSQWKRAVSLAESAKHPVSKKLHAEIAALNAQLKQCESDRALALRLENVHEDPTFLTFGRAPSRKATENAYQRIFREAGFDLTPGKEKEFVARVQASPIKEQLVVALDKFAWLAWSRHNWDLEKRLLALARLADPGPVRNRFRDSSTWSNRDRFKELLERFLNEPDTMARLSPHMMYILGNIGYNIRAEPLPFLREARQMHPDDFWINYLLGIALNEQSDPEAAGFLRAAISIRPTNSTAWVHLGSCMRIQGKLPEAIAAYEKALELNPRFSVAWMNLGQIRRVQRNLPAAIAAYNEALKINPAHVWTLQSLGNALYQQGNVEAAVTALNKMTQVAPEYFDGHVALIDVLFRSGNFDQAEAAAKRALACFPERKRRRPTVKPKTRISPHRRMYQAQRRKLKQLLAKTQELQALDERLPSVLAGSMTADAKQLLQLADLCRIYKKRYRDAVSLYARAFAKDAQLADDVVKAYRDDAARAAVLAAAGMADTEEQAKVRHMARQWLQSDLKNWSGFLKTKPSSVVVLIDRLAGWQNDTQLAVVRDEQQLRLLAEEERKEWIRIWQDAERLVKNTHSTEMQFSGVLAGSNASARHAVTMTAGKTYVIDMRAGFDTLLRLHSEDGSLLAENDDIDLANGNRNSRIVFVSDRTAVYHITATSFEERGRGDYLLRIRTFAKK